ncbi:serine/arginine-rich splicing factor 2 [Platysternon megacephalum]|uniref:Serine/arginine-rich splicing factor 2 n=1 Tax=Platysternon megacephalum TaxID=55544 RepID=A0A4D9E0V2_9SAUR|nr:serine/arginine-rich splicing factor 2 [Platysternon megacephalum]
MHAEQYQQHIGLSCKGISFFVCKEHLFESLNLECYFTCESDGGIARSQTSTLEDFTGNTRCRRIGVRTHMDLNRLVSTRYGMTLELEFNRFIPDKVWQNPDIWNSTLMFITTVLVYTSLIKHEEREYLLLNLKKARHLEELSLLA